MRHTHDSRSPAASPAQSRSTTESGVDTILNAATGAAMMQALAAAAELGVADVLARGPRAIDQLANELKCDAASLRRLLRALASLGMCVEHEKDVFSATQSGAVLQSHDDASLKHWVLWFARYLWPEWAQFAQCVRTGQTGRKLMRQAEGMEHLEHDPEAAIMFDAAMAEFTLPVVDSVADHPAFHDAQTVVDIGGGSGELLCGILRRHPGTRGVLFDRPHAIERARERLRTAELRARCELVTGDFFRAVPGAGDVYVLKSVIHDWNDDASVMILRHCRAAMKLGARVLVVEHLMPERMTTCTEHQDVARRDLTMLIGPGGRERTAGELRELLAHSGLACSTIRRAALGFSIMEAVVP